MYIQCIHKTHKYIISVLFLRQHHNLIAANFSALAYSIYYFQFCYTILPKEASQISSIEWKHRERNRDELRLYVYTFALNVRKKKFIKYKNTFICLYKFIWIELFFFSFNGVFASSFIIIFVVAVRGQAFYFFNIVLIGYLCGAIELVWVCVFVSHR